MFIVLSQMTTGPSYERVFDRLKRSVRCWDRLAEMPTRAIAVLIADAGLSAQKAANLKAIVQRLRADFGSADLRQIDSWRDDAVVAYLTSLPGVGTKTAKCVMLFSLGRSVLPVDTHVGRVGIRLGLVEPGLPRQRLATQLERVVPRRDRFDFHVNALVHGRAVCRTLKPKCAVCQLARLCPSSRARISA